MEGMEEEGVRERRKEENSFSFEKMQKSYPP
jgi:hypothetical protein